MPGAEIGMLPEAMLLICRCSRKKIFHTESTSITVKGEKKRRRFISADRRTVLSGSVKCGRLYFRK